MIDNYDWSCNQETLLFIYPGTVTAPALLLQRHVTLFFRCNFLALNWAYLIRVSESWRRCFGRDELLLPCSRAFLIAAVLQLLSWRQIFPFAAPPSRKLAVLKPTPAQRFSHCLPTNYSSTAALYPPMLWKGFSPSLSRCFQHTFDYLALRLESSF